MSKTRNIVFLGLLISLEVILTRLLSFQTATLRISFGFIPITLAAILYGPFTGGVCAVIADLAGMLILPKGAYFPGFTVSAFVTGFIYGVFLYEKPVKTARIFMASLMIAVVVDLVMNTLWLSILTGNAVAVIVMPRIVKTMLMLPVQVVLIQTVWQIFKKVFALRITGKPW